MISGSLRGGVEHPQDLPVTLGRAFSNISTPLDVRVTRDAVSPDSKVGLAILPDTRVLTAWDELEKAMNDKS